MKLIHLGIRFMLEICIMISLCYWGFQTGKGIVMKLILCIITPAIIAFIWGTFLSPKATIKLPFFSSLALEIMIFGISALALYNTVNVKVAIYFSIISIINISVIRIFKY